jgi:hypothetical protein
VSGLVRIEWFQRNVALGSYWFLGLDQVLSISILLRELEKELDQINHRTFVRYDVHDRHLQGSSAFLVKCVEVGGMYTMESLFRSRSLKQY